MKAAILVGGLGTRLKPIIKDIPKVMTQIEGIPLLEYTLLWLKKQGLKEIVMCTGYRKDIIKNWFGDGKRLGVNIVYSSEEVPLGTGGALANAKNYLKDEAFILINGDCLVELDLNQAYKIHKEEKSIATLSLTEATNPNHQELIQLKKELNNKSNKSEVINILQRGSEEHRNFLKNNKKVYCNSGIYIFEPEIFNYMPSSGKFTLEPILFPKLFSENKKVTAFYEPGVYIELGNPELYQKAKEGRQVEFLRSIKETKNEKHTS